MIFLNRTFALILFSSHFGLAGCVIGNNTYSDPPGRVERRSISTQTDVQLSATVQPENSIALVQLVEVESESWTEVELMTEYTKYSYDPVVDILTEPITAFVALAVLPLQFQKDHCPLHGTEHYFVISEWLFSSALVPGVIHPWIAQLDVRPTGRMLEVSRSRLAKTEEKARKPLKDIEVRILAPRGLELARRTTDDNGEAEFPLAGLCETLWKQSKGQAVTLTVTAAGKSSSLELSRTFLMSNLPNQWFYDRAETLYKEHSFARALLHLRAIRARDSDFRPVRLTYLLAESHYFLGDYEEARLAYERFVNLTKDETDLRLANARLRTLSQGKSNAGLLRAYIECQRLHLGASGSPGSRRLLRDLRDSYAKLRLMDGFASWPLRSDVEARIDVLDRRLTRS